MFPERIVCLSAESADICERLGAGDRVVAVTAFAPKPIRSVRKIIGGFSTTNMPELIALEPDLVITFSDVQAEISSDLIRNHCTVLATNQRSLGDISRAILLIGRVIGCGQEADRLAADFEHRLRAFRCDAAERPRVYFEEWDEPLISGIGWVSDIIHLVGGLDVLSHPGAKASREREVSSEIVCKADPQIILASWCGKPVDPAKIAKRPGWSEISAVKTNQIHAIDSADILQPGPSILAGVERVAELVRRWRGNALKLPSREPM
jgi:iron complex transport system substrate-binding protein